MNSRIENSISRISEQARGRFQTVVKNARSSAEKAADQVVYGKKPVKTISKLGLKLTAASHRTADKVLKQQTKMIENQIDAFAGRLAAAADAKGVRDLLKTQFRMIPKNAALFVNDSRAALGIVAGAGAEVRDLIKDTALELRGRKTETKKATTRKPATTRKSTTAPKKKAKKKVAAAKSASATVTKPESATATKVEKSKAA